jgi:hypothetical protein
MRLDINEFLDTFLPGCQGEERIRSALEQYQKHGKDGPKPGMTVAMHRAGCNGYGKGERRVIKPYDHDTHYLLGHSKGECLIDKKNWWWWFEIVEVPVTTVTSQLGCKDCTDRGRHCGECKQKYGCMYETENMGRM